MKSVVWLSALVVALLALSCTNTEQFRINGEIEGKPTMNIRVAYYGDGAVRTIVTAAREGKFEFFATSSQPTIVDITDYDFRPLVRLYAQNGETFSVKIDRAEALKATVSGNDISERWANFLRENSEVLALGGDNANAIVADYIAANPADIVSSLLLLTSYDSSRNALAADSLMALIEPQARPSALMDGYNFMLQRLVAETTSQPIQSIIYEHRDTAATFDPAKQPVNILAFTGDDEDKYLLIADSLERLCGKERAVVDFRAMIIHGTKLPDSVQRIVAELPAGLATRGVEKLGIPTLPYYIVADSAGTQFYRGRHLGRAAAVADSLGTLSKDSKK